MLGKDAGIPLKDFEFCAIFINTPLHPHAWTPAVLKYKIRNKTDVLMFPNSAWWERSNTKWSRKMIVFAQPLPWRKSFPISICLGAVCFLQSTKSLVKECKLYCPASMQSWHVWALRVLRVTFWNEAPYVPDPEGRTTATQLERQFRVQERFRAGLCCTADLQTHDTLNCWHIHLICNSLVCWCPLNKVLHYRSDF